MRKEVFETGHGDALFRVSARSCGPSELGAWAARPSGPPALGRNGPQDVTPQVDRGFQVGPQWAATVERGEFFGPPAHGRVPIGTPMEGRNPLPRFGRPN